MSQQTQTDQRDLELLARLAKARGEIAAQIGQRIVGQHEIVDNMISAILGGGHVLLVGVPGLAKTLLIQTIAQALDMEFSRIQFTPDLMPSDITGTELLEEDHGTGKRSFIFSKGPVFGNIVLADEINRAPPKTQAALLQAMQEKTVTVAGKTYVLPDPFFVLATQNPIEQEGTYPLPEAQLDRFMFLVQVGYPTLDEEREILRRTTGGSTPELKKVVGAAELAELQQAVRSIPVGDHVFDYALALTRGTRVKGEGQLAFLREWVTWGAGPRAGQFLVLGAKAHAALAGRTHVAIEDVRAVVHPVLRHRIVTNFSAAAEGITSDVVIDRLVKEVDPGASIGKGVPGVAARS